jgi:catechol 2,3-dioxygenase-like lactoylglutathione lyase family enzyme
VKGLIHHVELWVPDIQRAAAEWGWLLGELGYRGEEWENGRTYTLGDTYVVLEQSPDLTSREHQRTQPGLNHLAFHAGPREEVDRLVGLAPSRGWRLMFADRHPHAGGPQHYAGFLENSDGYEVELVAT